MEKTFSLSWVDNVREPSDIGATKRCRKVP
jgi:hypothetical protein